LKALKKTKKINQQSGGITDKKDVNAGSGAFNQGSSQDPEYLKGIPVSDEEKRTGHAPFPTRKKGENLKKGK
jgi:hypothetical protein